MDRRTPASLIAVVAVVALVMLIPIAFVVATVLDIGGGALAPLIFRPRVGELLVNTVLLVGLGVPLAVVLGAGGAWLVERSDLPGRRVVAVVLVSPLAIPAFVSSYGWASAIPSINGLSGALLVASLAYYPLVYLPVLATLRGLDPALEETARSLGLSELAVFFRVVLPQLRLALLGGALVVALHLLAEYGAFEFIRFDTFTTAIVVAYQSTFAGPAAASLGTVLATLCLLLLVGESSIRGRHRYSRIGSGSPHPAEPVALGRATAPALLACLALACAATAVPLVSVVGWLAASDSSAYAQIPGALAQTLVLAGGGAIGAVLVAIPVAWLTTRYPSRAGKTLESIYYLGSSLPGIIVALALVTVTLRLLPGLYQTPVTVMAAYVIVFMPRALVTLRAGMAQVPPSLEEAAESLGLSPAAARIRVTAPLLAPSMAAGAALVALGAANELTATLLLAPTGTRTLATQFWAASSAIDYPGAAPYALLLILLSVPAVVLMFTQARRRTP